jgi:hypothetical protein
MDEFWLVLIPVSAIVGVFTYSIVRATTQARVRELEVRERIAMIERGLVPPPEKDPNGFDRAMQVVDRTRAARWERAERRSPARFRTAGVTLMGIGFGLMLLISVAGQNPSAGVGVGGFIAIIGLASFINSLIAGRDAYDLPRPSPERSSGSPDPRIPPAGPVNGPA